MRAIFKGKYIEGVLIPYNPDLTWDRLNQTAIDFIRINERKFEELIELVWHKVDPVFSLRTHVDYQTRTTNAKLLGSIGEDIVLKLEREKIGRLFPAKVKLVNQVSDHYGFDISSFDSNGAGTMIEVKTTTMDSNEPFFMSGNQKTVAEKSPANYFIYRVCHLDISTEPPSYDLKVISFASEKLNFELVEFKVSLD